MSGKHWGIGLVVLALYSCDYLGFKTQQPVEVDNSPIQLNEVRPPLFKKCETLSEEELRECFEATFSNHINTYLENKTAVVTEKLHDTIWMQVLINNIGKVSIESISVSDSVQRSIPKIKTWLEESIISLPEVQPPYVRNQPTSTRYKLPVILKIN
ncbi:hypothetical protein [Aquimarina rhabdastrellae]